MVVSRPKCRVAEARNAVTTPQPQRYPLQSARPFLRGRGVAIEEIIL